MSLSTVKILQNYHKVKSNIRWKHKWICPTGGHDTGIKIYNCIAKEKVPLIVKNKHYTSWYTCGPTVYDSSHIGHASCYTKLDNIQRILRKHFGLNLVTVMNITDIDDKIIAKSSATKQTCSEITKKYEREFLNDLQALKVNPPDIVLRVTENIPIIISFIQKLHDQNYAYTAKDGSVYFDITALDCYGKLQKVPTEGNTSREESKLKKSHNDFALWKKHKQGEVSWDSPWGPGRPAWHIECSAIASQVFGANIDIHAGGEDLQFPHHENEEAQSCAFHGNTQWVNYWIHTGLLQASNKLKMSKSLKNFVSIEQLLKDTTADVFRIACLMSPYRSGFEYSAEYLQTAAAFLKNYKNFINTTNEFNKGLIRSNVNVDVLRSLLIESNAKIHAAYCDDFDTPSAIRILNEMLSVTNAMLHTSASGAINSAMELVYVNGIANVVKQFLDLFNISHSVDHNTVVDSNFDQVVDILSDFRQSVRQIGISEKNNKLLELCDGVRNDLEPVKIFVKDHGKISSWSR